MCDRKKDGAVGPSRFLLRRLYAARVKAQDTAQIEKTEKAAEKLAKTEKLTESEIAVKKQAIKDKVAEKNSDTTMINDHGHRLPK